MSPYANPPFGNGMVLQRSIPVLIWGRSDPLDEITVSIQGKTAYTRSDESGRWETAIGPLTASVAEILTISGKDGETSCTDVCIGEVWIAGGQSNMEFHLR